MQLPLESKKLLPLNKTIERGCVEYPANTRVSLHGPHPQPSLTRGRGGGGFGGGGGQGGCE